ncbi:hypothetical protein Tco_0511841 [Tanacetum coccineum]
MDVMITLLNVELDEEVCMNQPYDFIVQVGTPMDTSEKMKPNNVLEGYVDASWLSNTEENSSTSGWLSDKEVEWLKNLILKIPLLPNPVAPISIRCDSETTLAKAYSQMYNGKSRYLSVTHNMIHEFIINVKVQERVYEGKELPM